MFLSETTDLSSEVQQTDQPAAAGQGAPSVAAEADNRTDDAPPSARKQWRGQADTLILKLQNATVINENTVTLSKGQTNYKLCRVICRLSATIGSRQMLVDK